MKFADELHTIHHSKEFLSDSYTESGKEEVSLSWHAKVKPYITQHDVMLFNEMIFIWYIDNSDDGCNVSLLEVYMDTKLFCIDYHKQLWFHNHVKYNFIYSWEHHFNWCLQVDYMYTGLAWIGKGSFKADYFTLLYPNKLKEMVEQK
jgi:hypothetical protein